MKDIMQQTLLDDYLQAFQDADAPFLTYYTFTDAGVRTHSLTRGDFLHLGRCAAGLFAAHRCDVGSRVLFCVSRNHYHDLACRLGAAMTGCIPVTVNWQADTCDQVLYKMARTAPSLVLTDSGFSAEILAAIGAHAPQVPILPMDAILRSKPRATADDWRGTDPEAIRIIIFTSGTTGRPKGVELPYRSYQTNQNTFESLLGYAPGEQLTVAMVNPLHHTNSTAISDWAMRRAGSRLHLFERYSTPYWRLLADIAQGGSNRVIAPAVSRHIDFLAELDASGRLPLPCEALRESLGKVDLLLGSAPVGPTTVQRLQHYAGRLPTVRFGSTETCLQVLGIPWQIGDAQRLACFKTGWEHRVNGEPLPGYYIGRPTPPWTETRIVAEITPGKAGFMQDRAEGQSGYLVTRGNNLMHGYTGDPEATAAVFADGWYTGLRDIAFRLKNPADGDWDYYWVSRDSALLIRGGANYAYPQIEAELSAFLQRRYGLDAKAFELAVVGLRRHSEHEDECCVTIEWCDDTGPLREAEIAADFVNAAQSQVSKGARPDHVRFARIPRNFKGAILVPQLRTESETFLESPD